MRIKNLILMPLIALAIFGCKEETEDTTHVSQLGVANVMPTIGKIYIENVEIGENDGDLQDMRKAHLIFTLSGDIVVDDYSIIDGPGARCVWTSGSDDTKVSSDETVLARNEETGIYECAPVTVEFTKTDSSNYDPDTVITLTFLDKDGNDITQPATGSVYSQTVSLNTIDRHNIVNLATSPTSVLFHRKDGLFQSGYTAYRNMLGLELYIGSAMYEARVKAPGGEYKTDYGNQYSDEYVNEVEDDADIINKWLTGGSDLETIKSDSAFVSSYGPPIALPPFREGEIDYTKLRTVLMRHNNNPIIVSNDKKLYTMGVVTRFTEKDLTENFIYHIKSNDNWFSYSGVDISGDTASNRLHVGEIKIASGVEAKFVNTLSVTSDLGTIVSLNETDKEYYIAGNPHFNASFCSEGNTSIFDAETMSFDFNFSCTYNSNINVGAVKIPGLQRLIGDGNGAIATDNAVYYTGSDGKVYVVRYYEGHDNYYRIKDGRDVMPEVLSWDYSEEDLARGADELYPVEIGLPNMNPAIAPTMLMNDGSVAFPVRYYDNTTDPDNPTIAQRVWHFYVHRTGKLDAEPGEEGNIRIVKLLGPTAAYAEDGNIYYFTDVPSLGVSYNPQRSGSQNLTSDTDYLAFVYGDPVQLFDQVEDNEKGGFFTTRYGVLDINGAISSLEDPNGDSDGIGNDFIMLPYNPYTDAAEEITVADDTTVTTESVPYTAYRTNAHLIVNTSKNAKKNYIMVPYYFYGFDRYANVNPSAWQTRENGVIAAEVRHNDVAKVFGTYSTPSIPFKYTPYGRNTAFFGNKKGIFSFINYNSRITDSSIVDENGNEITMDYLVDTVRSSDNITQVSVLIDNKTPDFFYRAKVVRADQDATVTATVYEEAFSKNNYIGNAFVNENRMSNIPNNSNYLVDGFEPQLLSSWISAESVEYPNSTNSVQASRSLMAMYIPQYVYSVISTLSGIELDYTNVDDFISNIYQYAYGVGMYRVYSIDAYPVWRARKLNTEILQMQSRYGTLIPMTHGPTASYLFNNYDDLFLDGEKFNNSGLLEDDSNNPYVYPRIYSLTMYTTYDADMLKQGADISKVVLGGIDISEQNLGETIQKAAESDINGKQGSTAQGSGVGYILLDGNFMWRSGTAAANETGAPVSTTDPLNKSSYFLDFTAYHNN